MARSQEDLLDEQFGSTTEETEPKTPPVVPGENDDKGEEAAAGEQPKGEEPKGAGEESGEPAGEGEPEIEEGDPDEELENLLSGEPPAPKPEEEEEEEEEPKPKGEGEEEEESDFSFDIDNDTFEEITSSPKSFAEFIQKAVEYGVKKGEEKTEQLVAQAREDVLKSIPDVVGKTTERAQATRNLIQNFYTNNPSLADYKPYVRDITASVQSQNPDWTAEQVLDEVAKRAKRDLSINDKAKQREKKRTNPPFAGSGGRRSPGETKDNRTKQDKLLDQMFDKNR